MARLIDLTGQPFGRLIVKERGPNTKQGHAQWHCLCECGETTLVLGGNLRNGSTQSCGCWQHGLSRSLAYQRWLDMKKRIKHRPGYAGRSIDPRWESFECFYADMGDCPEGYSLERVDNDGDYSPENCKWIPLEDQSKNRSICVWLTYKGRTQILADWAREFGLSAQTLGYRIKKGWSVERALGTPVQRTQQASC